MELQNIFHRFAAGLQIIIVIIVPLIEPSSTVIYSRPDINIPKLFLKFRALTDPIRMKAKILFQVLQEFLSRSHQKVNKSQKVQMIFWKDQVCFFRFDCTKYFPWNWTIVKLNLIKKFTFNLTRACTRSCVKLSL